MVNLMQKPSIFPVYLILYSKNFLESMADLTLLNCGGLSLSTDFCTFLILHNNLVLLL